MSDNYDTSDNSTSGNALPTTAWGIEAHLLSTAEVQELVPSANTEVLDLTTDGADRPNGRRRITRVVTNKGTIDAE